MLMRVLVLRFWLVVGLLVLSGCASNSDYYVPVEDPGRGMIPQVEAETGSADPQSEQATDTGNDSAGDQYSYVDPQSSVSKPRGGGVDSLILKADRYIENQQYEEAAVQLERALRISPNDADIYYQLATVRLQQDNPVQAEQLARRGLSLSRDEDQREGLHALIDSSQAAQGK